MDQASKMDLNIEIDLNIKMDLNPKMEHISLLYLNQKMDHN